MKILYLGTAAFEGMPAMFCNCETCKKARTLRGKNLRARTQAVIDNDLMIDFNEDAYLASQRFFVDMSAIRYYLITHTHSDHFVPFDLDARSAGCAKNMKEPKIDLYGNETMIKVFNELEKNMAAATKSAIGLNYIEPYKTVKVGEYSVTALKAWHTNPEQSYIYIIEKNGKTLFYCNDTGVLPEENFEYLKACGKRFDFISFDCTYGIVEANKYGGHMSIHDCKNQLEKLKGVGVADENTKVAVTHFAHWYTPIHEDMEKVAQNYGFIVAYDGLEIEI